MMKSQRWFFWITLLCGFALISCQSDSGSSDQESSEQGEVHFTLSASAIFQDTLSILPFSSALPHARTPVTLQQVLYQGTLTVENNTTLDVQDFTVFVITDGLTIHLLSSPVLSLDPGEYTFSMSVLNNQRVFAGEVTQNIISGSNDVSLILRPVLGTTIVFFTLEEFNRYHFFFNSTELNLLDFSDLRIGVILDGGSEQIFSVNIETATASGFFDVPFGDHTIQVKVYDGNVQKGRSHPEDEFSSLSKSQPVIMRIIPLQGEVVFSLDEAGGEASFQFHIPQDVVDVVGGDSSQLEVALTLVDPSNITHEDVATLQPNGSDYLGTLTLPSLQFGDASAVLSFFDLTQNPKFLIGSCPWTMTLSANEPSIPCDLTLTQQAIAGGNLMATVGINVFDENNAPVIGATLSANGQFIGVTGSGTFGTPGYLKTFLPRGDYLLRAETQTQSAEFQASFLELDIDNVRIDLQ